MPIGLITKLFSFVKKHWHTLFLAWAAISIFMAYQKSDHDWTQKVQQLQELHAQEMKQVEDIRKAEQAQNDANVKKLQADLALAQKTYEQSKSVLSAKKQTRIQQIVADDGEDPVRLANELSKATGYKVRQ